MFLANAQLTADDILGIFLADEPFLFLGAAFTTIGFLCACFAVLRRRFDPLLLWLAAFAYLYGQRLWLETGLMDIALARKELFANIRWITNFLVPVPAFLFFQTAGLLPRRGKLFTSVLVSVFLCLVVATFLVGRQPILLIINNVVIIAALPFILVRTYLQGPVNRDFVILRRGLLCFVLLALWDNTVGAISLHRSIEPYGFAIFLGCLGYVAARRTLEREQNLNEIQKELEVARNIQLSILPRQFPASAAFDVAARYVPMSSVAGDFYDFLATGPNHAGLLIADVSGHGVPAALIASMVKMAASSQRGQSEHPAKLLTGMNAALCGNTQGQFVTAAYVHLNALTRELRYAAAGHPSMLFLRGGEVIEVAENGLLLAATEDSNYSERSMQLKPGDRLMLYTDGLLEARNGNGELFGEAALRDALRKTQGQTPVEAAQTIVQEVQSWASTQDDDLTVLVCDFARAEAGAPALATAD